MCRSDVDCGNLKGFYICKLVVRGHDYWWLRYQIDFTNELVIISLQIQLSESNCEKDLLTSVTWWHCMLAACYMVATPHSLTSTPYLCLLNLFNASFGATHLTSFFDACRVFLLVRKYGSEQCKLSCGLISISAGDGAIYCQILMATFAVCKQTIQ